MHYKNLICALAIVLTPALAQAQAPAQTAQLVVTDKSKANPKDAKKGADKQDSKTSDKKGTDGKK